MVRWVNDCYIEVHLQPLFVLLMFVLKDVSLSYDENLKCALLCHFSACWSIQSWGTSYEARCLSCRWDLFTISGNYSKPSWCCNKLSLLLIVVFILLYVVLFYFLEYIKINGTFPPQSSVTFLCWAPFTCQTHRLLSAWNLMPNS